ncbi:MAG: AAA family ATPase [Clostridia bacterium]|nr:AAA family ATPase [Clostridia bacterium]NCC43063.1 AAA family ATPase [Clostridia bacterium]
MNIKRAKQEIKDSIQAYLLKNEYGEYEIPVIRQRPILLIGAPGIGKTQIMEQIAQECKVGLVAYTITHHTRQSAIGLPFISKKEFGGVEHAVTEYTMSEIVASVYEEMEKTGLQEGILFIDEINCVSETLAPAMLQFLQCKTFGAHEIPQGWVIVAAGNPPEYNKSVREFDLVTLDRVKKIDVTPDYSVWKEYAYKVNIHPAVISYLNIRKQYFYQMETTVDGKLFATPRGWEDLSRMLEVYEKLGKEMDWEVIHQYIQHPKAAKDFANYLELYRKYQTDYQVEAVLEGRIDDVLQKKIAHASFDERLSVIGLFLSRLSQNFREYFLKEQAVSLIFTSLKEYQQTEGRSEDFDRVFMRMQMQREEKKRAKILSKEEEKCYRLAMNSMEILQKKLRGNKSSQLAAQENFNIMKTEFQKEKEELGELYNMASSHLEHVMDFMETVFGAGQEMVIFITELNGNFYSVQFLQQYDCERYYKWNEQLLVGERHREILKRMDELSL